MSPPPQHPWERYQRELFPRTRNGFPVWNASPEPGHPELDLGSVGFYDESARFVTLFSAMKPSDDPVNAEHGVPEGYVPLTKSNIMVQEHNGTISEPVVLGETLTACGGPLALAAAAPEPSTLPLEAPAATTFRATLKNGATSGAFLVMDADSIRERRIPNHKHIVDYMRQHHDSWLTMATSRLGHRVKLEQLTFISGTTKTTQYIAAAFELPDGKTPEQVSVRYDLHASPSPTVSVSADCGLKSFSYRSGSTARTPAAFDRPPQAASQESFGAFCIFLHYYKMKRRLFLGTRPIQAAAGPHNLPDDGRDPGMKDTVPAGGPRDPVEVLLDYILEHSDAELAIASTRQFEILFQDVSIPLDLEAAVLALGPTVHVDEHGVGMIDIYGGGMEGTGVDSAAPPVSNIPRVREIGDCHADIIRSRAKDCITCPIQVHASLNSESSCREELSNKDGDLNEDECTEGDNNSMARIAELWRSSQPAKVSHNTVTSWLAHRVYAPRISHGQQRTTLSGDWMARKVYGHRGSDALESITHLWNAAVMA